MFIFVNFVTPGCSDCFLGLELTLVFLLLSQVSAEALTGNCLHLFLSCGYLHSLSSDSSRRERQTHTSPLSPLGIEYFYLILKQHFGILFFSYFEFELYFIKLSAFYKVILLQYDKQKCGEIQD